MPRRNKRSNEVKRGRDNLEMTLGDQHQTLLGQTAFIKDAGGGACGQCGTLCSTLFADGLGPCCHKTVRGGIDELDAGRITVHRDR